jgi:AcrR family transcriptional regulator
MTNAGAVGPKTTKAQETALRIQMAAVDLVIQNGIDGTTVELICKNAGVSQRTFFNHFKTKELAIIGDDLPTITEDKARRFLASPPGDIFTASLELISMQNSQSLEPALMFKRLEMMTKHPELFALNLSKLMSVRAEHMELIYLRLRRNTPSEMPDDEVKNFASMISEITASYLRASLENQIFAKQMPKLDEIKDVGQKLSKIVEIGLNA